MNATICAAPLVATPASSITRQELTEPEAWPQQGPRPLRLPLIAEPDIAAALAARRDAMPATSPA